MLKHWVKVTSYLAEIYNCSLEPPIVLYVLNIRMVLLGLKLMEAVTEFIQLIMNLRHLPRESLLIS